MNKNQRITELEQESVKKYIAEREKQRVKSYKPLPKSIKTENSQGIPKQNVKQRLRTEIFTRPSLENYQQFNENELPWQINFTAIEKKQLLESLTRNYEKFKRITEKSKEKRVFLSKFDDKNIGFNGVSSEERAQTTNVYRKGEERIRQIFENHTENDEKIPKIKRSQSHLVKFRKEKEVSSINVLKFYLLLLEKS